MNLLHIIIFVSALFAPQNEPNVLGVTVQYVAFDSTNTAVPLTGCNVNPLPWQSTAQPTEAQLQQPTTATVYFNASASGNADIQAAVIGKLQSCANYTYVGGALPYQRATITYSFLNLPAPTVAPPAQ